MTGIEHNSVGPGRNGGARDPALQRKLRRKGLVLGLFAAALYVGYYAWFFFGGAS